MPTLSQRDLVARHLVWAASGIVVPTLVWFALPPELSPSTTIAAAFAPGIALAFAFRPAALLVALTTALVALGASALNLPVGPLAGYVAGAGAAWLLGATPWQTLNAALVGSAGVAVGAFVGSFVALEMNLGYLGFLGIPVGGAVAGALSGLSLWVARVDWTGSARIPSRRAIKRTLQPAYWPASLRASDLDRNLQAQSPDRTTRDGLGEVAAWVYRLSWTLQQVDGELQGISESDLLDRILKTTGEAEASSDAFTRERKLATAEHLGQLLRHRKELSTERDRIDALQQYALAFLEEARAGLALARMQPGDGTPAQLQDVLGRLRAHAEESQALRLSAREVALT